MNTILESVTYSPDVSSITDRRSPAWGAIVAGAVAGLAIHLLLLMLCAAIGLGAIQPATDDNPVATFSLGAAIAWSVSALISLFLGGFILLFGLALVGVGVFLWRRPS